ncbi:MAG: LysR family transcriptional regulator [Treponema sp.]|nr:LysR family transcriptional regulator [Treponema sp.]
MEFFQLRYFIEVAKHQHVRKSAELLHVTQPAVTNAIHKLEAELGVELFVSCGRNIRLTPCGKFLYQEILPFMSSIETLPSRIKEVSSHENATVRLNILAAWTLITEAIIEYQRIDNNLNIQLIQNEQNDLADITVSTVQHYRPKKKELSRIYVCTEPIYLAVPNIPRFQKKNSISLQDVKDDGFIQLAGSKNLRAICDHFCALADVHPRTLFESDSPSAVRNMIGANMGIGFWPGFSWGKVDTKRVLLKTISKPQCSRDILIEKRKNKIENMRIQLFYDWLTKYVEIFSQRCNEM